MAVRFTTHEQEVPLVEVSPKVCGCFVGNSCNRVVSGRLQTLEFFPELGFRERLACSSSEQISKVFFGFGFHIFLLSRPVMSLRVLHPSPPFAKDGTGLPF